MYQAPHQCDGLVVKSVSDRRHTKSPSQKPALLLCLIASLFFVTGCGANRGTEARRTLPKTVLSGLKRAIGRSDSAHALSQQYAEQRAKFTAANVALKEKGCPVVELPLQLQVTEPWTGQT
jgi:hypothetical protein